MTIKVTSGILDQFNKLLGLTGGAKQAYIDDGNISTVIGLDPIIRRSRSLTGQEGLALLHVRPTPNNSTSRIIRDPYNPGAGNFFNGYPSTLPEHQEVWIAGVGCMASGTADNAAVGIYPNTLGPAISTSAANAIVLAWWDTVAAAPIGQLIGGGDNMMYNSITGRSWHPVALRIPKGWDIRVVAQSKTVGASQFDIMVLLAIMPKGFGQDMIGAQ